MYRQIDIHIFTDNAILFSHKKKGNTVICDNMNESRGYYANEIDQTEKDKYCMIKLTWGI